MFGVAGCLQFDFLTFQILFSQSHQPHLQPENIQMNQKQNEPVYEISNNVVF